MVLTDTIPHRQQRKMKIGGTQHKELIHEAPNSQKASKQPKYESFPRTQLKPTITPFSLNLFPFFPFPSSCPLLPLHMWYKNVNTMQINPRCRRLEDGRGQEGGKKRKRGKREGWRVVMTDPPVTPPFRRFTHSQI